nr:reverse transcriptase domain-containing protein [Tanacetum cinerariifolium]
MKKHHIFCISVDIMQNTNFVRAFTASADVPLIYIQQLWNTLGKDIKTGVFSFQLYELWFDLNADLLCNALGITPKDSAHPFVSPPVGKIFGSDKPRHPTLQMLWGVVTGTNVDYAELIWEEFIQAIKNFFSDMANLKVLTKKPKPHVIPYYRFTKLIIYYLGHAPAKQPKHAKKKTTKPSPSKKIRKGKRSDHIVDEKDDESQPASEPQVKDDEYNLQRDFKGKRKGIVFDEQATQSLPNLQKTKKHVGNKMHKAFPLLVRKFPLPEGTSHCLKKNATASRKVLPLPEVCTAIIVKDSTSGNPTPLDPIIASSSPSITPFKGRDFILEEIETFLRTPDELSNLDDDYYDTEGDIIYLEKLLNEDPSSNLPLIKNEDLKQVDVSMTKPSIEEPSELELNDLPSHLKYAFLEGTDKLPVIISKELNDEEKVALLNVLKSHKRAIA